jgi:hypothetical protein
MLSCEARTRVPPPLVAATPALSVKGPLGEEDRYAKRKRKRKTFDLAYWERKVFMRRGGWGKKGKEGTHRDSDVVSGRQAGAALVPAGEKVVVPALLGDEWRLLGVVRGGRSVGDDGSRGGGEGAGGRVQGRLGDAAEEGAVGEVPVGAVDQKVLQGIGRWNVSKLDESCGRDSEREKDREGEGGRWTYRVDSVNSGRVSRSDDLAFIGPRAGETGRGGCLEDGRVFGPKGGSGKVELEFLLGRVPRQIGSPIRFQEERRLRGQLKAMFGYRSE